MLWLLCTIALGVGAVLRRPPGAVLRPSAAHELRVMTWNLRNFPGDHNQTWMQAQIAAMKPDIVAFQEILDPAALSAMVPELEIVASHGGGRNRQHLALAYDPTRLALGGPTRDEETLTLGGRLRPAFVVPLQAHDGERFDVIVVHLKATAEGYATRRLQWDLLIGLLEKHRVPAIVLGDFNVAGGADEASPAEERDALDARMHHAEMVRLGSEHGCTAYWHGVRYDTWLEPSELDLLYVRASWLTNITRLPKSHAGAHCRTHRCRSFASSEAYPEESYTRGSDHCPMMASLPWPPSG